MSNNHIDQYLENQRPVSDQQREKILSALLGEGAGAPALTNKNVAFSNVNKAGRLTKILREIKVVLSENAINLQDGKVVAALAAFQENLGKAIN
jgi:hypothetical protein